ncbi:hypothetical protein F2P56_018402 [Juglans regia]|uniref:Uncharacterized protein n=2 Tax=Juglans regia TaxID=51240 RepID=A0A833UNH0_JUGRE|nr:uncharacterized protein LOC108993671 [Juglans regia]KAF5462393.1 hypothetical protein F2P56_018402 [Juglans regia]
MTTYIVNVDGVNVKTSVTDGAFVDSFITELALSCNYMNISSPPLIGLDLINMEVVPQSLFNFLSAPVFCFVGVGIVHYSLSLLKRYHGLECRNVVDLMPFLKLAVFSGQVGIEPKPLSVLMGDWSAGNLSMEQIESAASDAFTYFEFGKLFLG